MRRHFERTLRLSLGFAQDHGLEVLIWNWEQPCTSQSIHLILSSLFSFFLPKSPIHVHHNVNNNNGCAVLPIKRCYGDEVKRRQAQFRAQQGSVYKELFNTITNENIGATDGWKLAGP